MDLVDIWRIRHPNEQTFTQREKTKSGLVQSRLDFFLIVKSISYQVKSTDIKPGYESDHSIITLKIELLNTIARGPGFWKFNNKLLRDREYIKMVKKELNIIVSKLTG